MSISGAGQTIVFSGNYSSTDVYSSANDPFSYGWSSTVRGEPDWTGGETLVLRVAGSSRFPPLEAALVAPFTTVVEPIVLNEKPSGAQHVSWSPAKPGGVQIAISPSAAGVPYPSADCWFEGAAGGADIPEQVLSELAWPTPYQITGRGGTRVEARDGRVGFYAVRSW